MRKVIKILGKVLSWIIVAAVCLPLIVVLLLNVEGVQNFVVDKATGWLSGKLGTTVAMDHIRIRGFSRVTAEGFYVEDYSGDTLLYASRLGANLSKSALLKGNIVIGDAFLDGAKIYLFTPTDGEINIAQVLARLSSDEPDTESSTRLVFNRVDISDSRFKLQTEGADTVTHGVNFGNMVFDDLSIHSRRLVIDGGAITMDLHDVSFKDISGFAIRNMSSGELRIDDGLISLTDTEIVTPDSDLVMPRFSMKGSSWEAMSDILDSVRFDVRIDRSRITTDMLGYFVPGFGTGKNLTLTDAEVSFVGAINDFDATVSFGTSAEKTHVAAKAALRNVIDLPNASFAVDVTRFETDGNGVAELLGAFMADSLSSGVKDILDRAGRIGVRLRADGRTGDFGARLALNTDAGGVAFDGRGGLASSGDVSFSGALRADNVNAGRLLADTVLGRLTAEVHAAGRIVGGQIDVRGDVSVPNVQYNGYDYGGITASGGYTAGVVDAVAKSVDPKLLFSLAGRADIGREVPYYDIDLDMEHVDMHALNIDRRDSVAVLGGRLSVLGSGSNLDNINGRAVLSGLYYRSSADTVRADTVIFMGRNSPSSKYLAMNSSFADIEFSSGMGYMEVFDYLKHVMYDYLPALSLDADFVYEHDNRPVVRRAGTVALPVTGVANVAFAPVSGAGMDVTAVPIRPPMSELHINIKEASGIAAIFLPGFSIAQGTEVNVVFDPKTEDFRIDANSDYIEYSDFFVTRLGFKADNTTERGAVNLVFTTEDLYLPKYRMPSNNISARIQNDTINVRARLSDGASDLSASLDMQSLLSRTETGKELVFGLAFEPTSYVMTGPQRWNIASRLISYSKEGISVDDFAITSGDQRLQVDGGISSGRTDTLRLELDRFSVGIMNGMLNLDGVRVGGTLDGSAQLVSGENDPFLIADIAMDSLRVNDYVAVPLRLRSAWNFADERVVLSLRNETTGKNIVRGFYRPDINEYSAEVDVDNIPLAAAGSFLPPEAVSALDGSAAIFLEVRSRDGKPDMHGTLSVSDLAATVGMTNVTYRASLLDVDIDGGRVVIPRTVLTDNEGNSATLEAHADISNMANISYDLRLVPTNLMAINTTSKDNAQFYGKVYVSGAIGLRGGKNGMDIDVAVSTQDRSAFYLPLSNKSSISEADWIVFVDKSAETVSPDNIVEHKKQQYLLSRQEAERKKKQETDMRLNVSLTVTPGLLLSIIIDPATNMTLNAKGAANIDVQLNPGTGELATFGTYEIAEGDFLFSLPPIISNRKFTLQPGGTIQLSGDPMEAVLNVEAVYKMRASLQPIASSFEGTGINTSTRIPVDCVMRIRESLKQPDISFDIRIPSADADVQNVLSGILSSNENTAMNFIWLVGLGSFAPDGSSSDDNGAATATSAGASLGLDFLTNQLTNVLSSENFDILLNYRPQQDETSSDELDFGFTYNVGGNDRLILEVEGNYDIGNNNPQNVSNMSGDASITWLLTPSGDLRLKGFTRTITRYDENQGLQENGVGIYYREDFNRFGDIVRKYKMRREKRRQNRIEKRRAAQTVVGDSPGNGAVTLPSDGVTVTPESTSERGNATDAGTLKSRIEQRRAESEERRRRMIEERREREEAARAQADSGSAQKNVEQTEL